MQLAGIQVANDDVLELARLVDEPTATLLHTALEQKTLIVALTVSDRERLLWALDDARAGALPELRAVLLNEHEARVRGQPRPCWKCKEDEWMKMTVASAATSKAVASRTRMATSGSARFETCVPNFLIVSADQSLRKSPWRQSPPVGHIVTSRD